MGRAHHWPDGLRVRDYGVVADQTKAGGSLHIRDKAAANSTVFLACRPRSVADPTDSANYWEDVEPQVAGAVRKRVEAFQSAGIRGVDLFLAAFGPALEEFSRHWPLRGGEPRNRPQERRGQQTLLEEPWDPYARVAGGCP